MSASLYIISGASGSGKTLLLSLIDKQKNFKMVVAPKYSTRLRRKNDFDDIVHVDEINDEDYTFVYPMNNFVYGIKANEITKLLLNDYNIFIILSDLRVVQEVKQFFGSLAVSLYIYRNLTPSQLSKILKKRNEEKGDDFGDQISFMREKQTRLNRLYLMQRQYVDNITIFDHVILNTSNSTDMLEQVNNIVSGYNKGIIRKGMRGPVIFLIAAASGSGKRTLMSAMYNLGRKRIEVVKKATTRKIHDDDGPEIYHVDRIDPELLDINYTFHDTEYGINTKLIWDNLSSGKPQIVITNIDQFSKFKKKFDPLVVCIYLHATRTRKQLYEWQLKRHGDKEKAKLKVNEIKEIHCSYIKYICEFQHILLNTLEIEDFWDQMFRLITFYKI